MDNNCDNNSIDDSALCSFQLFVPSMGFLLPLDFNSLINIYSEEKRTSFKNRFLKTMRTTWENVNSSISQGLKTIKSFSKKRKQITVQEEKMRVMSFNVRWGGDTAQDEMTNWNNRKDNVASMIKFHNMDIVGLQEPNKDQVDDLELLLSEYSWYGVGFEDGKGKGQFNPIFFRKERFLLLDKGFFFLSSTPQQPGLSWHAWFPRGVSWVKLQDQINDHVFFFFNTHFDYHSKEARDKSVGLLCDQIAKITKNDPFIVTGDFNLFPELGGKDTYEALTKKRKKQLFDAQEKAIFPHHGPTGTWSGFKEAGQPGIKPDYIFVDKDVVVVSHGVLADTFDGQFPSDHLPVIAEVEI